MALKTYCVLIGAQMNKQQLIEKLRAFSYDDIFKEAEQETLKQFATGNYPRPALERVFLKYKEIKRGRKK